MKLYFFFDFRDKYTTDVFLTGFVRIAHEYKLRQETRTAEERHDLRWKPIPIFPIWLRTSTMSVPVSDGFLQPRYRSTLYRMNPLTVCTSCIWIIYIWRSICGWTFALHCHGLKRAWAAVGLISLFQSASVRLNSTGEPNSGRLQCTTLHSKTDRIRQVSSTEQVF